MSSERDVPDSSNNSWAPAFWALMIVGGLAYFLYNFGSKALAEVDGIYPAVPIQDLTTVMFTTAIFGGGATVAIVAFIVVRYGKPNRAEAADLLPGYGKYTLVIFAIGVTFLMLTVAFMGTQTLALTDEADDPVDTVDTDRQIEVDVTAAQFLWTFDVDDGLAAENDEMVLPADTVIHLNIESEDVIHSFKIFETGMMKDAMPGTTNHGWFIIEEVEGEEELRTDDGYFIDADLYHVTCAELCGEAHSEMIGDVYIVEPEDYIRYVQGAGGELPESFLEEGDL